MNELFITVLSLSVSGTLLILLLLLFRPLFKERLSKRWQYYIWLIVIARLLLPFTPGTSLMGTLFQEINTRMEQTNAASFPEDNITTPPINIPQNEVMTNGQNSSNLPAQHILTSLLNTLWLIWLVLALILMIRKITIYQGFVQYIRAGCTQTADINLLEQFGKIIEKNKIRRTVDLCTNNLVSTPLMIGFFRPCIILPATDLSASDFEYTIKHELIHFRRGDMFYKWLVQLTVCLHWFNPFVYLISREISRTCELSCDEAVIRTLDTKNQRAYGDTLLNSIRAKGSYKNALASVTLNESKELLKERLDAIMKFKKTSKPTATITALCTILFCIGAATIGAYAAPSANNPTAPWTSIGNSTKPPNTYSQSSYYQAPYMFELGWNIDEKGYNFYPDKAKVTLSDKTVITVSFDHAYKDYAQNNLALSSLKVLLETLKAQNAGSSLPLEKPLIVSIKYIGQNDLGQLAEKYYTNHTISSFAAIFPALDADTQKAYCNKMLQDNENAFFAAILKSLDTVTINSYADKAYEENKLTFFADIVPYLTKDAKQSWIAKSSQDKRNTFLAVLINTSKITGAQNTIASLPSDLKELNLSLDIYNGGAEILPTSSNEITATYDSQYYDVQITEKNRTWVISITGKVAKMGETSDVQLHIPDTKRNMAVHVLNGDFRYKLIQNCKDKIDVTAADSGVHISSDNHYANSSISLKALNKDFMTYEAPVYPAYFTKTDTGFKYQNGTEAAKINVTLTGYVDVDFDN